MSTMNGEKGKEGEGEREREGERESCNTVYWSSNCSSTSCSNGMLPFTAIHNPFNRYSTLVSLIMTQIKQLYTHPMIHV